MCRLRPLILLPVVRQAIAQQSAERGRRSRKPRHSR
jgi:hypothetical protein